MQWSQLKSRAESFLAPSLAGRVKYYATQYRHSHDGEGRCWITVDGVQLVDMSTLRAWADQHRRAARARGLPEDIAWRAWGHIPGAPDYWHEWEKAEMDRKAAGIYTEWDFRMALAEYLQLSIDEALTSDEALHRALAILDRRLGKRQFKRLAAGALSHPLVRAMYDLRAQAESWPTVEPAEA
jgi:hypothetical protein